MIGVLRGQLRTFISEFIEPFSAFGELPLVFVNDMISVG